MKTAMQELIDSFYKRPEDFRYLGLIISECKKLLEKEKQQIFDAFEIGNTLGYDGTRRDGMKYYNETFKD